MVLMHDFLVLSHLTVLAHPFVDSPLSQPADLAITWPAHLGHQLVMTTRVSHLIVRFVQLRGSTYPILIEVL